MSHVTEIDLRIRDLDALDEACQKLGLDLQRDKKTFAWWGRFERDSNNYGEMTPEKMGTCAHAIKVSGTTPITRPEGPWEIGLMPASDGDGFKLYYDTFGAAGSAITRVVENDCNALRREYAAAVSTKKSIERLSRHGWRVEREELPNQQIKLKLRRR